MKPDPFDPFANNIPISPEYEIIEKEVVAAIDVGLKSKRNDQPPRKYLGASRVGDDCERRLAYEYHQFKKDEGSEFKGKTLRIFDMGHDGEERMAEYLRLAGFDLHTHNEEGKQFGMSDAEGKFKGHLDGVIHGGPAISGLKYPCLWENKALGDKSWNDFRNRKLFTSKPVYYAQVQVYMGYFDLSSCLFTALNRDTGEIGVEVVQLSYSSCQKYINKAVGIVNSQTPDEFKRIGKGVDDYKCKWCDYKKLCYGVTEHPEIKAVNPADGWHMGA